MEGVNTEAALAVADFEAAFEPDGHVGNCPTEEIFFGIISGFFIAIAENQGVGRLPGGIDETRQLFGVELAIGVDGGGVGVAESLGGEEAGLEGGGLAEINFMGDDFDIFQRVGGEPGRKERGSAIGGAIVDDDKGQVLGDDAVEDVEQCGGIVIGGG